MEIAPCPVCGQLFSIKLRAGLDLIFREIPPSMPRAIVPGGLAHLLSHLPDGLTDDEAVEWTERQLMAMARQQSSGLTVLEGGH